MYDKRIVITGIGAITSVGNCVSQIWNSLVAGESGIGPITRFDSEKFSSKITGEIKSFDIANIISPKEAKRLDPFCHYAIAAATEAVKQSNLDLDAMDCTRVGTLVGSGIGGIITLEKQLERCIKNGPSKVSPFLVPMMIGDMASGSVAIQM